MRTAAGSGVSAAGGFSGPGEKLERTFTHMLTTAGIRRTHLRGPENILKRTGPDSTWDF